MPPSEPPADKPASRTIVCPKHNLRYDPLAFAGCMLCRREASAAAKVGNKRFILVGSIVIGLLFACLVAVVWPRKKPPAVPIVLPPIADAGLAAVRRAPPDAATEGGCDIPFVDSDPELAVPELRHRCNGKDGSACTRLGFVCDRAAAARYPHGVFPSKRFDKATCEALSASTAFQRACAAVGSGGSWFNVGCNAGDWLGCIQPSDPLELEKSKRTDKERRTTAENQCNRNQAAACAELALPFLTKSSGVRAAYSRITDDLVACRGRNACAASADALAALAAAKVAAEQEATEAKSPTVEMDGATIDALKRACVGKDASACLDLARVTKNPSNAGALLLRACELGSLDACLSVHVMSARGAPGLPDFSRTLPILRHGFDVAHRRACSDAADAAACGAAAGRLAAETFPARPAPLSRDAAQNACDDGNPSRCMEVAQSFAGGRAATPKERAAVTEYKSRAMSLWNKSCDGGVGASCLAVARLLSAGPLGTPDVAGAALYAKKGCNDAHDRASCIVLAKMYENGDGMAKDAAHAKRCLDAAMDFSRAATAGCP
jgi:TPR repeat protein